MVKNTITTIDFEEFYARNEPDNAGQLACLYRSVRDCTDEDFFETREVTVGKVTHEVIASSGDILRLTNKSYRAFMRFVEKQNSDPELDIEERVDFEYAINNPNS